MCVIAFVEDDQKRPSTEEVEAMFQRNPAGAGIAWRHEGLVRWRKGLELEEIDDLVQSVPAPFVAHFRIPTCGNAPELLTHPFPISPTAELALEGSTDGFVLFHNGHWGSWEDKIMQLAAAARLKLDDNAWSDSRAMAWVAGNFGLGCLELIKEKIIAFGPEEVHIYSPKNWSLYNKSFWVSNDHWVSAIRRPKQDIKRLPAPIPDHLSGPSPIAVRPQPRQAGGPGAEAPFFQEGLTQAAALMKAEAAFQAGKLTKNALKRIKKKWAQREADQKRLVKTKREVLAWLKGESRSPLPVH